MLRLIVDLEIDINKQKTRERIGLVVFIMAMLGIFAAVFGYLTVGHGFDLSASDIDSNVGQLDGYLTLVFDGDNDVRKNKINNNDILKAATDFFGVENSDENKDDSNKDEKTDISTEPATIDNVKTYYQDKGSTVCTLKCSDYEAYTKGQVFERDSWKIGVISVTQDFLTLALNEKKAQIKKEAEESGKKVYEESKKSKENVSSNSETSKSVNNKTPLMKQLQAKINNLRRQNEADIVLILSPHQDVLDLVEKVDCAICKTVYDDIPNEGKVINSVFTMRVPATGSVGTILTTPAKMFSGHVYTKIEINEEQK